MKNFVHQIFCNKKKIFNQFFICITLNPPSQALSRFSCREWWKEKLEYSKFKKRRKIRKKKKK